MTDSPIFVVAACVVKDNNILLARRHQPSSPQAHLKWELPGGKVDFLETPDEAVVRELREELNIVVRPLRLLPHLQSNIYHKLDETTVHSIVAAFECVLASGSPSPKPDLTSVTRVRWVPLDDLGKYDLLPGTQEFVECLKREDRATLGQAEFVRLAKRGDDGQRRYTWEITALTDLWSGFNLLVRWADLKRGTSKVTLTSNLTEENAIQIMRRRVSVMVKRGYDLVYPRGRGLAFEFPPRLGGL